MTVKHGAPILIMSHGMTIPTDNLRRVDGFTG